VVSLVLRSGLALATTLMVVGALAKLLAGDHAAPTLALTGGLAVADLLLGAGVVVLMLTPLVRILVLIGVWARDRDWRFVAVGVGVLAVLVAAALLGGG
jgi:uncharacterized membrane protein